MKFITDQPPKTISGYVTTSFRCKIQRKTKYFTMKLCFKMMIEIRVGRGLYKRNLNVIYFQKCNYI